MDGGGLLGESERSGVEVREVELERLADEAGAQREDSRLELFMMSEAWFQWTAWKEAVGCRALNDI